MTISICILPSVSSNPSLNPVYYNQLMKFKVDQEIFEKFPGVRIGVLVLKGINNQKGKEKISELLRNEETKQHNLLAEVDFGILPQTADWRKIYEQFGSKPRDFRSSIEALLRRARSGKPLPHINPLVDLYNYLSICFYLPAGAEDLDKIVGDIELTFAKGDERGKYIGAAEEDICYEGEVIYKDDVGFICRRWNWREAERTKIEESTGSAVMVLEALPTITDEKLKGVITEAGVLIKDMLGGEVTINILSRDNLEVEMR